MGKTWKRSSLQIREETFSAALRSVPLVSTWWAKAMHQQQPHSFTGVWHLLNPWAVFLVCNLEGFVICQACANVHMVKTFKCFCHTQRALAELPFPDPLLGGCVRRVTSQPRWAFSACPAHPCPALLWGLHSHLRTDFPRFRHVDTQNFSVYAFENT